LGGVVVVPGTTIVPVVLGFTTVVVVPGTTKVPDVVEV
jgi:hypothetical protein